MKTPEGKIYELSMKYHELIFVAREWVTQVVLKNV